MLSVTQQFHSNSGPYYWVRKGEDGPHSWAHYPKERPRWNSRILTSLAPRLCCCGHMRSEQADEKYFSVTLPFKLINLNKTNKQTNIRIYKYHVIVTIVSIFSILMFTIFFQRRVSILGKLKSSGPKTICSSIGSYSRWIYHPWGKLNQWTTLEEPLCPLKHLSFSGPEVVAW